MVAVARHFVDGEEAEDVVQDALLRLWQLHDRLSMPLDSLARVLVRNLSIDHLRRRKSSVSIDKLDVVEAAPEADPRYERVMKLVDALPPVQQAVMRMRNMEGMEYEDIARLIGSTPQAVRQVVSRARRAILDKYKSAQRLV